MHRVQPLGVRQAMSPFAAYGVPNAVAGGAPSGPGVTPIPGIARSQGPTAAQSALGAPPWSPQSALFWFGLVAAATFGLAGVSFSGRVGSARASASLGNA